MSLDKWRCYLLDRHFKIKIDHFSLKYLLHQRLTTPFQSKWLPKLLGFDYAISYKKGCENKAVDALSRMESYGEYYGMVSGVSSDCMLQIEHSWSLDADLQELITKLQNPPHIVGKYVLQHNQMRRNGKVVVGPDYTL